MDGTAKRVLSKERLLRGMVTGEKEGKKLNFEARCQVCLSMYWFEFQLGMVEIDLSGRGKPQQA